jgi:hypothetical protein
MPGPGVQTSGRLRRSTCPEFSNVGMGQEISVWEQGPQSKNSTAALR